MAAGNKLLEKNAASICARIFAAAFSLYFAAMFVLDLFTVRENALTGALYMLCALACVFAAYRLLCFVVARCAARTLHIITILGCAALLAMQLLYVRSFYTALGWDVEYTYGVAEFFVKGGEGDFSYILRCPNNTALFWLFSLVIRAFGNAPFETVFFALIALGILLADAAVFLGALFVKRAVSTRACAAFCAVCAPLILFNPSLSIPYTDVYTMPFAPLTLLLWQRANDAENARGRVGFGVLTGAAAAVGFCFKPTAAIAAIAVIIISLLCACFKKTSWKNFAAFALALLVSFAAVYGAYECTRRSMSYYEPQVEEEIAFPTEHYFMVGLHAEGDNYGGWNPEDSLGTGAVSGQAAKKEFCREVIARRLSAYGVGGYAQFLALKSRFIWSDGTLWYAREGSHYMSAPYHDAPLDKLVQSFVYPNGSNNDFAVNVQNGLWLGLLLALALSFIGGSDKNRAELAALRLCVVGITLFLLLFEARSRYLINHLPVVAALFAVTLCGLEEKWTGRKSR